MMEVIIDETNTHVPKMEEEGVKAQRRLLDACGLIPGWILDAEANDSEESFVEIFRANYCCGVEHFAGGHTDEQGFYCYPEDPPLAPYLTVKRRGETFRQYPYAMVTVTNDETGEQFITRMD